VNKGRWLAELPLYCRGAEGLLNKQDQLKQLRQELQHRLQTNDCRCTCFVPQTVCFGTELALQNLPMASAQLQVVLGCSKAFALNRPCREQAHWPTLHAHFRASRNHAVCIHTGTASVLQSSTSTACCLRRLAASCHTKVIRPDLICKHEGHLGRTQSAALATGSMKPGAAVQRDLKDATIR
jgi:hypothetical protein